MLDELVWNARRRLRESTNHAELAQAIVTAGAAFGVRSVALFDAFAWRRGEKTPFPMTLGKPFMLEFAQRRDFLQDAVLNEALRQQRTFVWDTKLYFRRDYTGSKDILDCFKAHDLQGGLFLPSFAPDGFRGALSYGGAVDALRDTKARAVLLMLAVEGFERHWELAYGAAVAPPARLTPRELECLRWAAQGKTAWDIGEITQLSSRTVESYLKSACLKLGAVTRAQAVASAVRHGLIR